MGSLERNTDMYTSIMVGCRPNSRNIEEYLSVSLRLT
ncbi:MAG: hypothetical protein GF416_08220 [Candidatus Altiarchaeales archaeon]|nr:hypothetical protein [Candidatus Altiarchaeales archaeon]MBD3417100.1 hypothetical protein [Candidatus Altiarchaeales archaeon]